MVNMDNILTLTFSILPSALSLVMHPPGHK